MKDKDPHPAKETEVLPIQDFGRMSLGNTTGGMGFTLSVFEDEEPPDDKDMGKVLEFKKPEEK